MGGSVSSGKSNDELIDHLVEADFLQSPLLQRVFRAVDRGNYFVPSERKFAYKDAAWQHRSLHLSAPSVYSVVLEALQLEEGCSFLNIGSGTGYFNTVAGLVLGVYGVNHGIELDSHVVEYAYEKLDEFLKLSNGVDLYDFCEPIFTVGNSLAIDASLQQYDRVYCGAFCAEEYELYVKNLVKVGGIIIMPLKEKLIKLIRTDESTWKATKILPTNFASLSLPSSKEPLDRIMLDDLSPPTLQIICRSRIRSIFRGIIHEERPNIELKLKSRDKYSRTHIQRLLNPSCDPTQPGSSMSEAEREDSESQEYTIDSKLPSSMTSFLKEFLRRHAEVQLLQNMQNMQDYDISPPRTPTPPPASADEDDSNPPDLVSIISLSNLEDSSDDESWHHQSGFNHGRGNLKRKQRGGNEQKRMKGADALLKRLVDLKEVCGSVDPIVSDDDISDLMAEKIGKLSLPKLLQRYVNYNKENHFLGVDWLKRLDIKL